VRPVLTKQTVSDCSEDKGNRSYQFSRDSFDEEWRGSGRVTEWREIAFGTLTLYDGKTRDKGEADYTRTPVITNAQEGTFGKGFCFARTPATES
jgi:hypothetical protein